MLQMQKAVAVLMSFLLVLTTFPVAVSAQNAPASGTQEEYGPLGSEELDGIVAPIALYPDAGKRDNGGVAFWLRIAAFALYSSFIAYLLVDNSWNDVQSLLLYSLAMAFHLLLVDHSLAEQGHKLYESRGRWILALIESK
jgi:hypothetical protein